MYLSSSAKAEGHDIELVLTSDDLEKKVSEFKPEIIVYSVMTGNQKFYLRLNKKLKSLYKFISVFGGPHLTFFPEFIQEESVDVICRGEGEEAFVELLDRLEQGKNIENIFNLWIKGKKGDIYRNDVRPFVDIDSLPFPDRDLVFKFTEIRDAPIKHFLASRGCPFNCAYCFNEKYYDIYSGKGRRVRMRNVKSLIYEIEEVVECSQTGAIYFLDDIFTLNREWLASFAEEYSKRVGLPFYCHVRADTLTPEKVNYMRIAGCAGVSMAAETASDRLRNEILNRKMEKQHIIEAASLLRKNDIKLKLQNMIGLPTGNLEDDLETLEMNIEINPDYAWVSIFQPYPGTKLGEFCRDKGFYEGDYSDLESNFFDSSKLNFTEEYKNQLANLQKLFAVIVMKPEKYSRESVKSMISAPRTPDRINAYNESYRSFRQKAEEKIYGFKSKVAYKFD